MRIFLACVHFHSSFGWSIEQALVRAGHEVHVFDYRRPPYPSVLRGITGLLWRRRMPVRLVQEAARYRPDLVWIAKGETIPAHCLDTLRRDFRCLIVNWFPDPRLFSYPIVLSQLPHLDLFCSKNRSDLDRLHLLGFRNMYFLPHAADKELHVDYITSDDQLVPYHCEAALVGSHYPYREAMVAPLAQRFNLRVWGSGWDRTPLSRTHPECVIGREARSFEQTRVFRGALVNLNPHHFDDFDGLNQRFFDIAGSGAFQLLDGDRWDVSLLEQSDMVESFKSLHDLQEKLRYFTLHPEQARSRGSDAQRIIREHHTYDHRIREILERLSS